MPLTSAPAPPPAAQVPEESQKPPALPEPAKSQPLKVKLRPVHKTPAFDVKEDEVGFSVIVHDVSNEDPHVELDGQTILVRAKSADGDTVFSRAFKLPRAVVNSSEISAVVEACPERQGSLRLVVSVPKHALVSEHPPAKQKIAVQSVAKAA
jgi:hypothetical protein